MRRAAPLAAALGLCGAPASPAALEPAVAYMLECQGCHGADGLGTAGSVPPLAGSVAAFLRVPGGREYLIRVPGSAQSSLDDAELAAVLNWIVERFGPAGAAGGFAPFTAGEVARHRRDPLVDVEAARRDLLRRMGAAAPQRTAMERPPRQVRSTR